MQILDATLEDALWWLVRQSKWACVLTLGFIQWADVENVEIGSWNSICLAVVSGWPWLLIVVVASLWIGLDFDGRRSLKKGVIQRLDERSNYAIVALMEMRNKVRIRVQDPNYVEEFSRIFEPLLHAACMEYAAIDNLPSSTNIKANLLLLTGADEITVVARSTPGSPVPVKYSMDSRYPAAKAIALNKTYTTTDVHQTDPSTKRPYRSVAATPLESKGRVYGAITIDSPKIGLFHRKEEDVDRILRVYGALVLLLMQNNLSPRDCPNRYGH